VKILLSYCVFFIIFGNHRRCRKVRLHFEKEHLGRVSIGGAAEITGLPFREFDEHRARARIPIRGPED
jgi:predicted HTH domain antitoxin